MATTKKKSPRARAKPRRAKKATVTESPLPRRKGAPPIDLAAADHSTALEMKGERLVVRLARDSHPEVFEIDRLLKQVRKVIDKYNGNRKMRDFREFLEETQKSLEIILSNHLEDALRKYLR
jgi:hypothetical protein